MAADSPLPRPWRRRLFIGAASLTALITIGWFWLAWGRYVALSEGPPSPLTGQIIAAEGKEEVRIAFAGDTMLAWSAKAAIRRHGHKGLLRHIAPLVRSADLGVVNLEAPVTDAPFLGPYKQYKYRQSPKAIDALSDAGFQVFALGNNHTLDCGEKGLVDTITALEARGLWPIGAGVDEGAARRGLVVTVGPVKLGLLSYYKWRPFYDLWLDWYALGEGSGVAELIARFVEADVRRLRAAGADVVIVTPHWGRDYEGVTWRQRAQARMLRAAGVDAVMGHGTHVLQPMAVIEGMPVIYSMGNFAFGTVGRPSFTCGLLPFVHLDAKGVRAVEIHAIVTQNRAVDFQPRPTKTSGPLDLCLRDLKYKSAQEGTELKVVDRHLVWERDQ